MTRTGRANRIIWKTVVSVALVGCGSKPTPTTTPVAAEQPPPAPPPVVETRPEPPPAPPPAPEPEPEPATITVRVMSKPAGADVYIDDELRGKTPLELVLPMAAGEIDVKVQRAGYADKTVVVNTEADQAIEVALVKNKKRPRGNIGTVGHGSGSGKGVGRGFVLS